MQTYSLYFYVELKTIIPINLCVMKILLDIDDQREQSFMEMIKKLDYIKVLKQFKDDEKNQVIQDLAEAFNDVKQYEEGKKDLTSAQDLLDELWSNCYQPI